MKIDENDASTILAYMEGLERKRGYTGPCIILMPRLIEIHMPLAYVIAQTALLKLKG